VTSSDLREQRIECNITVDVVVLVLGWNIFCVFIVGSYDDDDDDDVMLMRRVLL